MGDSIIRFEFSDEDSPVVTTGRECLFVPFRDAAVVGTGSPMLLRVRVRAVLAFRGCVLGAEAMAQATAEETC
jgi:hypothetical protein